MAQGWKVVRQLFGSYLSVYEQFGMVEYVSGEETYPIVGNGPLAVFDNKDNAERFKSTLFFCGRVLVVPCEYEPSEKSNLWTSYEIMQSVYLPYGTVTADWVIINP